jgi:hypothetical protein
MSPVCRELWLYLLRKVNHKDGRKLKRGQGFFTYQDIIEDLCWYSGYRKNTYKKYQISKALRKLNESNMTATTKATRGVIVTICNYGFYQDAKNYEGNAKATGTQREGSTKDKNVKNEKKKEEPKPFPQPDGFGAEVEPDYYLTKKKKHLTGKRLETFETFWNTFAYKSSKAEAADAWLEIPILTEAIFKQILQAAEAEAMKRPGLRADGKTPKMAEGWIRGRRWEDEDDSQLPTIDAAEQTRRMLAEKLA